MDKKGGKNLEEDKVDLTNSNQRERPIGNQVGITTHNPLIADFFEARRKSI